MIVQMKQLLYKYFKNEFGEKYKPNFNNLRSISIAYKEENCETKQVIADLQTLRIYYLRNRKIVKIDHAKNGNTFLYWLKFITFDNLISECAKH